MVIIIGLRGSQTVVGLYQECWSGSDRSPRPTSSPSPPIPTSSSLSLEGLLFLLLFMVVIVIDTTCVLMMIGQRLHQFDLINIVVAQDKKDSMRANDFPDMASRLMVVMMNKMVVMAMLILVITLMMMLRKDEI